ncbi:SdpI family protein [Cryomorphaceae bacterium 1068]|nr:SdpI family protein [Cryomorphaceae bacterium 1068]
METLNPIALIPIVVSPIFVIAGLFLVFPPPRKAIYFYGYRTKRSMRNQESWDYAQPKAGRQLVYLGMAYFCTSFTNFVIDGISPGAVTAISLGLLIIGVLMLFRRMENELRDKLD